jgi:hypothetical protein
MPEIRFHHALAWLLIVKKSSDFSADEYLVGTTIKMRIWASIDRM